LRSCIARSTLLEAFFPYFLAMRSPFVRFAEGRGPPALPEGRRTSRHSDARYSSLVSELRRPLGLEPLSDRFELLELEIREVELPWFLAGD
jgi:hypothetical protein